MISKIIGIVDRISGTALTMKIMEGVYWDIFVPSGLLNRLKNSHPEGASLTLFTLEYIESPSSSGNAFPHIIGFTDENDREFFRLFTTVDGVGFKKALKALTKPVKEVATAIETGDIAVIRQMPGLGSRTAEKIIAALKGKVAKFALLKESEALVEDKKITDRDSLRIDAIAILGQLGYNEREASGMVEKILEENPKTKSPEELINMIFKKGLTTG